MGRIQIEEVQRQFTVQERLDMGQQLADLQVKKAEIAVARKEAVSHYKAQMDGVEKNISELTQKLKDGYELEPVKCDVYFNIPSRGMKTLTKVKTGEHVAVKPMTDEDKQMSFLDDDSGRGPHHQEDYRPDDEDE